MVSSLAAGVGSLVVVQMKETFIPAGVCQLW